MAAWTATEMATTFGTDVGVILTPVGKGRFELWIDDEKVYDCKAAGKKGIDIETLGGIKDLIRAKLSMPVAVAVPAHR